MRSGSCIILDDDAYYDAVKFSPDGKHVAVSDADGIIKLWNVRERRLVEHWWGHSNAVLDLAFTPDGRGLISASVDKTLKYWDVCQPGHRRSRNDDVLEEVLEFVGHAVRLVPLFSQSSPLQLKARNRKRWCFAGWSISPFWFSRWFCNRLGHG